jgi:hypothetical protein
MQADVDLSILCEEESLTSFCWTPNGTLLLGTSQSRLLAVLGAAPVGLPGQGWGAVGAPGVLTAIAMLSPADTTIGVSGAVVHVAVSVEHVMLVLSGGGDGTFIKPKWYGS